MKNLTITLPDETFARLRVAAAKNGKSMSKFVGTLVERQIGSDDQTSRIEAMERFLAGPLWDLTDENGKAPTRDQIYER
jgi:plasmid stability protein